MYFLTLIKFYGNFTAINAGINFIFLNKLHIRPLQLNSLFPVAGAGRSGRAGGINHYSYYRGGMTRVVQLAENNTTPRDNLYNGTWSIAPYCTTRVIPSLPFIIGSGIVQTECRSLIIHHNVLSPVCTKLGCAPPDPPWWIIDPCFLNPKPFP